MNQIKKYNKAKNKKEVQPVESHDELKQLIIIVLVIAIFLFVVYVVSTLLKGKDYSSIFDNSLDTSEIQYDEILVGTILKQLEDTYYVLVLDEEDPYKDILQNYVSSYRNLNYEVKLYTVDLNNLFNKTSKLEEDEDSSKLTFRGTTFLKVENHEIVERIEDSDEIGSMLISMNKELEDSAS